MNYSSYFCLSVKNIACYLDDESIEGQDRIRILQKAALCVMVRIKHSGRSSVSVTHVFRAAAAAAAAAAVPYEIVPRKKLITI